MLPPLHSLHVGIDGRFLTDAYPGIGRYIYNLLRHFPPDAGCISVLVEPSAAQTRFELAALSRPGLCLIALPRSPHDLFDWVLLPRLVRRLGCTVFHIPHVLSTALFGRWPCPVVTTAHDLIPVRFPETLPSRLKRRVFSACVRRATRLSARVLTVSQTSRRDLVTYAEASPEQVAVTYLAADPDCRVVSPSAVSRFRQEYRLPERYVLYVGANKAHKNLLRLIEAWTLSQKPEGWGLVLAGAGLDGFSEARNAASQFQDVVCIGQVRDAQLPTLYTGAAAYVQPSVWEGFGLPVLEAMACGTPVMCSDTPALVEVTGPAAVHFPARDVTAMAAALSQVMGDGALRCDLRRRGHERVQAFSWRQTAEQTLAVYRAVGAGGSRADRTSSLS